MKRREIRSWLMDMDGVLVHEQSAIPGADRFLERLRDKGLPFLVLTNNSMYTRRDLAARLLTIGLDVPEEAIWTSALATANFLADQRPGGTAFAIGEAGLTTALHDAGYTLTDQDPDYVVLGETRTTASSASRRRSVSSSEARGSSRPTPIRPDRRRTVLCRRPVRWPRSSVGLPASTLFRRQAEPAHDALGSQRHRRPLGIRSDGRRPDGHRCRSGLEAGMHTVLVLTGITSRPEAERFPYRPSRIVESIADLIDELG